ncbi:hypothetical protein BSKO_03382 [Bryopsis sp. KO-2023]|nr:hypothetical protein BSKO_03382 [Bryopsis sp. KO-2023]
MLRRSVLGGRLRRAFRLLGLQHRSQDQDGSCKVIGGFVLLLVVILSWTVVRHGIGRPVSFVIVIDGGSTGTRIYVYSWKEPADPAQDFPKLELIPPSAASSKVPRRLGIRAYNRVETLPGLDSFLASDELRTKSLGPLLNWARAVIPSRLWRSTPVFLFGTAGLRNLPTKDREALVSNIGEVLKESGLRFEPSWAKTMTGDEEGMYGWVAVNYTKKRLRPGLLKPEKSSPKDVVLNKPPDGTIDALDMGGSSLEITREVNGKAASNSENVKNVTLAGRTYSLQSHTYKQEGLNSAFDRSVAILLAQSVLGDGQEIEHPCMLAGYNDTHSLKEHATGKQSGVNDVRHVRLIGEGDWAKCRDLAAQVLQLDKDCEPPCGLNHWKTVELREAAALNGFYVVWKFFELAGEAGVSGLEEVGKTFCQKEWSSAKKEFGDVVHLDKYCFRAPYAVELLQRGLGVQANGLTVMPEDVSWTKGAALVEGFRVKSSYLSPHAWFLQLGTKFVLKSILAVVGLACVVFLCFHLFVQPEGLDVGVLEDGRGGLLAVVEASKESGTATSPPEDTGVNRVEVVSGMAKRRTPSHGSNLSGLK